MADARTGAPSARTRKRRTAARVLAGARFLADLRAEMAEWDDYDDCMQPVACGSCGIAVDPDDSSCWYCGEEL